MFTHNACACLHILFPIFFRHPWYLIKGHTKFPQNPSSFGWEIEVSSIAQAVCMYSRSVHAHTQTLLINPEIRWKFCEDLTSFSWDIEVWYGVTQNLADIRQTDKQTDKQMLLKFNIIEFEGATRPSNSSPSREVWWAFGPSMWAFGPLLWAFGPPIWPFPASSAHPNDPSQHLRPTHMTLPSIFLTWLASSWLSHQG